MKKILLIFAAFIILGTVFSSCQLQKPLCPAYSQVEVETPDVES